MSNERLDDVMMPETEPAENVIPEAIPDNVIPEAIPDRVIPEEIPESVIPEDAPQVTEIGSGIPPMYGNPSFPGSAPQDAQPVEEESLLPPKDIPYKEFVNFFDLKQKKGIAASAIICYVCAALTVIVAMLANPMGAIDGLILLALALGLHLTKHKGFAIAILVVAIIEFVAALALTGIPNGWLWLLAGVLAVYFTFKADKNYKAFKETGVLPE